LDAGAVFKLFLRIFHISNSINLLNLKCTKTVLEVVLLGGNERQRKIGLFDTYLSLLHMKQTLYKDHK